MDTLNTQPSKSENSGEFENTGIPENSVPAWIEHELLECAAQIFDDFKDLPALQGEKKELLKWIFLHRVSFHAKDSISVKGDEYSKYEDEIKMAYDDAKNVWAKVSSLAARAARPSEYYRILCNNFVFTILLNCDEMSNYIKLNAKQALKAYYLLHPKLTNPEITASCTNSSSYIQAEEVCKIATSRLLEADESGECRLSRALRILKNFAGKLSNFNPENHTVESRLDELGLTEKDAEAMYYYLESGPTADRILSVLHCSAMIRNHGDSGLKSGPLYELLCPFFSNDFKIEESDWEKSIETAITYAWNPSRDFLSGEEYVYGFYSAIFDLEGIHLNLLDLIKEQRNSQIDDLMCMVRKSYPLERMYSRIKEGGIKDAEWLSQKGYEAGIRLYYKIRIVHGLLFRYAFMLAAFLFLSIVFTIIVCFEINSPLTMIELKKIQ
ncbi:uncharacterized protein NEMAJ01_1907 [Nematocida major]|uniref:uncharacterized protein n=1 Tax=Nematocida major TaxID=1912982 RepID=UPI0020079C1C|nr:uncharacterized protein NEMAJ01_1907 [Nematocida major]KAH9387011.1 hypothetical protein NEMAJ01_1907 [Nematocida major]